MVRLSITPALPVVLLVGGSAWLASSAVGLARRIPALVERARAVPGDRLVPTPLSSPSGLVFTVLSCLLAVWLIALAIRWLTFRVVVSPEGFSVRLLPGGHRLVPTGSVKGVALNQSDGSPQLRIVPKDGAPLVLPGWSLRAVHPDGEVEPAGPALERLGAELGFKVRVRTLLSEPVEGGPRP